MYQYKIINVNYEEHSELDLFHEKKFTTNEIVQMYSEAMAYATIQQIENNNYLGELCALINLNICDNAIDYDDDVIINYAKKFLVEKYNFVLPKIDVTVFTYGSCWGTGSDENYDKLYDIVKKEVLKYMNEHSIKCKGLNDKNNCINYFEGSKKIFDDNICLHEEMGDVNDS